MEAAWKNVWHCLIEIKSVILLRILSMYITKFDICSVELPPSVGNGAYTHIIDLSITATSIKQCIMHISVLCPTPSKLGYSGFD